MKNRYVNAIVSSSLSILPIVLIVVLLSLPFLNIIKLTGWDYLMLGIGAIVLILGLALFQIGAATGITKVGEYIGTSLSKQPKLFIVILFSLTLGTLITCAEPSILIFSKQVTIVQNNATLNAVVLIGSIALGVGIFVVIGVLRIILQKSLKLWYLIFYMICFMLICLISLDETKRGFLPIIFDSGGVTTGSATVPFILALGAGVATVRGGRHSTNDSFGLVGIASVGPILTMCILILINSNIQPYSYSPAASFNDASALAAIPLAAIPNSYSTGAMIDVGVALSPILAIFFVYQSIYMKLPRNKILKLLIGFGFSYIGLVLFLSAASAVMSPMGDIVGRGVGSQAEWVIILISFVIGLVTILCEPAVHVLTTQMETISSGQIKKTTVLLSLSLGVGIAIGLSAVRAILGFSILYLLVPCYTLALVLMFAVPDIYAAMAFDSGGTASGPMSTSFVLPMIIGIVSVIGGSNPNYYEYGFGVVALIAITPIIAIQVLGVANNVKRMSAIRVMRKAEADINDAQIIHFN